MSTSRPRRSSTASCNATFGIEVELLDFARLTPADVAAGLAQLPAHEQARALRYSQPEGRAAFVSCRLSVRRRLAALTGLASADVPLVRDDHGRPHCQLAGLPHFSISHSHGLAAIGWCDQVLGVDLELAAPPGSDDAGLALLILSAPEQARYLGLPAPQRAAYLIRAFNAKEAVLKAMGCGMHVEPHRLQSEGPHYISPAWGSAPAQRWQVHQQRLQEEWLLSVAAPAVVELTFTGTPLRQSF